MRMKRIALAWLLAILNGSTAAEWVGVSDSDDFIVYADPATIRRAGNLVTMSDLTDLKFPRPSPLGKQYSSSTAHSEFDCQDERIRTLYFTLHSGQMGGGDLIETVSESSKWLTIAPESVLKILWRFACGKN